MREKTEFIIQNGEETLLALNDAQSMDFQDVERVHLDPEQRKALGRLFQGAVRPLLEASQLVGSNTYRLVLSPELNQALQSGVGKLRTLEGELTGTLINKDTGRVLGHAQLKPGQVVQLANFATIGWQVAAMVTAQHFLAEINQELKSINRKLDDVQEFLETQATGRILAQLNALQRGTQLLQLRPLDAEERSTLQRDIQNVMHEAEAQIAQHALPFGPLRASLEAARDFSPAEVQRVTGSYAKHINTALFAARAYLTALNVAAHAGWAEDRVRIHRESITELLKHLMETVGQFSKDLDALEVRGRERDPKWTLSLGVSGVLIATVGLMPLGAFGVLQQFKKRRRTLKREKVMQEKRPLLAYHRASIEELSEDLAEVELQVKVLARLGTSELVLLAEFDSDGNVQSTFQTKETFS